jgi:hypothetical protein
MAATNYTPIQLYYSTTASAAPVAGNLASGELAINITDGKLYYKDNGGTVQVIATKGSGTIGGSDTQIQYNNAGALGGSAAMTFNSGTSTVTLTTLNLTNALGATYGGTAQSTYTQGDILYSSATNTLAKLGIGTTNYILTSSGSVPQWAAPSSISVNTATNLAGGLAGSVPYQSAVDTTTFLAIGAANRVMTSTGTAPQWVTSLTGLTGVSSSSITNTSLTSGRVVLSSTGGLQADDADLTFDGTTLSAGGFSTVGLSTLVRTVKIGDSNFNGVAVFAPSTPAKLYIGTGTVTDTTSAIGATNATGAVSSLAITPIAATNTSVTYTNAATLYIAGAPSAGTNVTLTNPYSLYVAGGTSYFGGAVNFAVTPIYSGGTANGVMYLNASKEITTGIALVFDGTTLFSPVFWSSGDGNGLTLRNTANTGGGTVVANTGTSGGITISSDAGPMTLQSGGSNTITLSGTQLVGIGVTSPAAKLHVYSATSGSFTSPNAQIGTNSNAPSFSAQILAIYPNCLDSDYLSAYNTGTGGNNNGASFVIANAGRNGTSGTVKFVLGLDAPGGATVTAAIGTASNHALSFGTNSVERARFTTAGRFVIGGTSASAPLHVYGDGTVSTTDFYGSTFTSMLQAASGNNTTASLALIARGPTGFPAGVSISAIPGSVTDNYRGSMVSTITGDGSGASYWAVNNFNPTTSSTSELARLTYTGNFGIGANSPTYRVQAARASTGDGLQIAITNNNGAGTNATPQNMDLDFLGFADGTKARIRAIDVSGNAVDSYLSFWTRGGNFAERARITGGGFFGLGTTDPLSKLTVSGTAGNNNGITSVDSSNSDFIRMYADASFGSAINWSSGDDLRFCTSDSSFGSFFELGRFSGSSFLVGASGPDTAATAVMIERSGTTASTGAYFVVKNQNGAQATNGVLTPAGGILFSTYRDVRNPSYTAGITYEARGVSGTNTGAELIFRTAAGSGDNFSNAGNAALPAERARIDYLGSLLVGKTSATNDVTTVGALIQGDGKGVFTTASNQALVASGTGTATRNLQEFFINGSIVGAISCSTTATAYNTSSDYRLKNTIAPMTGALAKVALLKPCTYKWNSDGSDGEGFIAHELAEVVPQCVTGEKDAVDAEGKPQYQGIDTSFLVATLTAAIQELKAEFDAYKASHP